MARYKANGMTEAAQTLGIDICEVSPYARGTRAGYQRHKKRGLQACDECLDGNATVVRDLYETDDEHRASERERGRVNQSKKSREKWPALYVIEFAPFMPYAKFGQSGTPATRWQDAVGTHPEWKRMILFHGPDTRRKREAVENLLRDYLKAEGFEIWAGRDWMEAAAFPVAYEWLRAHHGEPLESWSHGRLS